VRDSPPTVPVTVINELLVAALQTGVSIPRALKVVGAAIGGRDGPVLAKAGRQLELGAPWHLAWVSHRPELATVADALRPAWESGVAPTVSLRAAAQAAQRSQQEAARLAAARVGVRLVLPLGLCLLPAFILIGLVPVLLSLGSGLWGT
jgi:pilus assembly protein TadC